MSNSRGNKRHVNRTVKKHNKTSKRRPSRILKRNLTNRVFRNKHNVSGGFENDSDIDKFIKARLGDPIKGVLSNEYTVDKELICALIATWYNKRNTDKKYNPNDITIIPKNPLPQLVCGERKVVETASKIIPKAVAVTTAAAVKVPVGIISLGTLDANSLAVKVATENTTYDIMYNNQPTKLFSMLYYPKHSSYNDTTINKYLDIYVFIFSMGNYNLIIRLYHNFGTSSTLRIKAGKLFFDYSVFETTTNLNTASYLTLSNYNKTIYDKYKTAFTQNDIKNFDTSISEGNITLNNTNKNLSVKKSGNTAKYGDAYNFGHHTWFGEPGEDDDPADAGKLRL